MQTLATYPYVVVRVACQYCTRRGVYRLARLSAEYGPDMALDDILLRLSASCHFASDRTGKPGCHGVYLPDREHPTRDPDLPPQWPRKGRLQLRIISGGRPTKEGSAS